MFPYTKLLSFLFSDVLPPNSLHPEGTTEENPLFHFPSDGAAAVPLYVWNVPTTLYENDLPSSNVYSHTYQVGLIDEHTQAQTSNHLHS